MTNELESPYDKTSVFPEKIAAQAQRGTAPLRQDCAQGHAVLSEPVCSLPQPG